MAVDGRSLACPLARVPPTSPEREPQTSHSAGNVLHLASSPLQRAPLPRALLVPLPSPPLPSPPSPPLPSAPHLQLQVQGAAPHRRVRPQQRPQSPALGAAAAGARPSAGAAALVVPAVVVTIRGGAAGAEGDWSAAAGARRQAHLLRGPECVCGDGWCW